MTTMTLSSPAGAGDTDRNSLGFAKPPAQTRVVVAMSGEVRVRSASGKGAVFVVLLPTFDEDLLAYEPE